MRRNQASSDTLLLLSMPTVFLGIGSLIFYSQVALGWWKPGTPMDFALTAVVCMTFTASLACAGGFLWRFSLETYQEAKGSLPRRLVPALCGALAVALTAGLFSAIKPSHLIQESDFPNYHLMLVKQYWLAGSWKPLEWSIFEYRSMLIQNGFSFLWVGLPLLNKLPQFLTLVFLLLKLWFFFVLFGIARPYLAGLASVLCLLAFRGIAIQVGMAMIDLPAMYFLVSAAAFVVYLMRSRSSALLSLAFGLDVAAYLGHKSFGFIFLGLIAAGSEVLLRILYNTSLLPAFRKLNWKWVAAPILAVWVPNLYRAYYYTGDPLFPVLLPLSKALCNPAHLITGSCAQIVGLAEYLQSIVGSFYGYGHHLRDLVKSFWVLALAKDGSTSVTNAFDYPLGFFWYFTWALMLFGASSKGPLKRPALFTLVLSAGFFLVWFAGSQQSRWLYPVLIFLALGWGYAVSRGKRVYTIMALVLSSGAVTINTARVIRSQRNTLGCLGASCLKNKAPYYEDYERHCENETLQLTDIADRGYLTCRIQGPLLVPQTKTK